VLWRFGGHNLSTIEYRGHVVALGRSNEDGSNPCLPSPTTPTAVPERPPEGCTCTAGGEAGRRLTPALAGWLLRRAGRR